MSRPLRSTATPASSGFTATTGRSASERRVGTQCLRFLPRHAPSRNPDHRVQVAVSTLTFSRSVQEPQTRITPPLRRAPPGQEHGHPPSSSREGNQDPRFRCHLICFDASTAHARPEHPGRTLLERLPGPHLTRSSRAFSPIAHHDGLQPTQHQGGLALTPAGPTLEGQQASISRTAPPMSEIFYTTYPSAFVTHDFPDLWSEPRNPSRQSSGDG
jgi:hypothetical protein